MLAQVLWLFIWKEIPRKRVLKIYRETPQNDGKEVETTETHVRKSEESCK
jgi:hypothetical protein